MIWLVWTSSCFGLNAYSFLKGLNQIDPADEPLTFFARLISLMILILFIVIVRTYYSEFSKAKKLRDLNAINEIA